MMKLIYPLIKYIDGIDKNKSIKLQKVFLTENMDMLDSLYKLSIEELVKGTDKKIYKKQSIFDDQSETYVPFKELDFNSEFIKRYDKNNAIINKEQWDEYIDKVTHNIIQNKENYIKVFNICMKYLSNVPAINNAKCKISLFDMCKLNAALYNCIQRDNDKFLLIKGDFSGIQKFIYKTKDDGALKDLKGRSLYLSLLQDLCAKCIINNLKLDISNILYSGGGNFYIIASYGDIEEFEKIKKSISKVILDAHKGEVYLALAYTEFEKKDLNNFSEVWKSVGNRVGVSKNKRWSELGLDTQFETIFGPFDDGGTLENNCTICGGIKKDKDKKVCDLCDSYKRLVDDAKNKQIYVEEVLTSQITENNLNVSKSYSDINDIFADLGYKITFRNNENKIKSKEEIYSVNDFSNQRVDGYIFKSIRFNQKSLDNISESNKQLGDKKIGVLKLDVDNLGKLFIQTQGISEVMGLSRAMSLFFEVFVEKIIFENKKLLITDKELKTISNWEDKITVIYAGGDDTFIVGRYDEVFEFSIVLRDMFSKYTNNERRTFSAGVGMFNANFPILRTAEITEGFLNQGKDTLDKDKICFMGEVFTWEQFRKLIRLKNNIENIYESTGNKAVFEKIDSSTKGFKSIFKKGNNQMNYVKVYKLAYYLRDLRNTKDYNTRALVEKLIDEYENLCLEAIKDNGVEKEAMIIPYANRWAQCNCRKVEKGNEING